MRAVVASVILAAMLVATPALACRSVQSETHAYLPVIPTTIPEGAVVIRLPENAPAIPVGGTLEVEVAEVVTGVWDHETAALRFERWTSCSRIMVGLPETYVVGLPRPGSNQLTVVQYNLGDLDGGALRYGDVGGGQASDD